MLYVICFVNRSGSNHLCDLLRSVGIGDPREYYYPHEFAERCRKWNVQNSQPDQYFQTICKRQGSVVGIKIEWNGFANLRNEVDIDSHSPKYILLTRDDKARQAISWLRAEATGKWTSHDSKKHADWDYDKHELDERIRLIHVLEKRWQRFFAEREHLKISYEDLSPKIVYKIAEYLGIKLSNDVPQSRREIQRDAYTEEILKKYEQSSLHNC